MSDKFAAVKATLANIERDDEQLVSDLRDEIAALRSALREIARISDGGTEHAMKLISINARQALERSAT